MPSLYKLYLFLQNKQIVFTSYFKADVFDHHWKEDKTSFVMVNLFVNLF